MFGPFFMIFVFLGPLWWILTLASCGFIIFNLEKERGIASGLILLATLAAMVLLGDTPIISYCQENKLFLPLFGLGYFIIGAIWGIIRWKLFVNKKYNKYIDYRSEWLKGQGINSTELPDNLKEKWYNHLITSSSEYSYETSVRKTGVTYGYERAICVRPIAMRNKASIGNWVGYWPWSFAWWLLADAVTAIVNEVTNSIMGFLEKISIGKFQSVESDWKKPEKTESEK